MGKNQIISNSLWVDGTIRSGYVLLELNDEEYADFKKLTEAEQIHQLDYEGEVKIEDFRVNDSGDVESFEILEDMSEEIRSDFEEYHKEELLNIEKTKIDSVLDGTKDDIRLNGITIIEFISYLKSKDVDITREDLTTSGWDVDFCLPTENNDFILYGCLVDGTFKFGKND